MVVQGLKWHYGRPNTFGGALKQLRVSRGIGRHSLAVMSGIQERRLADLEANQSPPSYQDIKNLATILCVSEEELLRAAGYLARRQEA